MRTKAIKSQINQRMHFERRFGKQEQAIQYCKKDNVYEENGVKSRQGYRRDLTELREKISEGITYREILKHDDPPTFSDIRFCDKAFSYLEAKRNFKSFVYWCHGGTGTGKTRFAHTFPDVYKYYQKMARNVMLTTASIQRIIDNRGYQPTSSPLPTQCFGVFYSSTGTASLTIGTIWVTRYIVAKSRI